VGYLAQNQNIDSAHSIYEELREMKRDVIDLEKSIRDAEKQMDILQGDELTRLMEKYAQMNHEYQLKNGYAWESEVIGVAKGLGFSEEEFDKRISTLSGGQKTRVALGKLLLQTPDLIILDEPTNHLDMNSIKWLEGYLMNYKGAVLVVSHDRYFLDRIAQKVIEIDNKGCDVYQGNYSAYAKKREQIRAAKLKAYLNQQAEIKHQEEVIEKLKQFNREKSIKRAESREKMLDKIERLEKPVEVRDDMRITLTPSCVSGMDVMHVDSIAKSFGSEQLFKNISFDIKRGERVAIIGDNGTGKTTMLKIINNMETLDAGEITLGVKVHIGYYDQEHQVLHNEKTLFEELSDAYPSMNNTEIRNTLAAFLFTGDDVFKRIGDLSGGEKGRVSLAKLMLSDANFLILDEPTNHLDITSKEILEDALCGYEGTILYVSHDRYFINRTATRILDLTHGHIVNYVGDYDYYVEHCEEQTNRVLMESGSHSTAGKGIGIESAEAASATSYSKFAGAADKGSDNGSGGGATGAADWKAQKEEAARKRKQEAALKKCEEEIAKLEERNEKINAELSDPEVATDLAKVRKLSDELSENEDHLGVLYDEWAELSE
ncbi:MAG: ABC-F family ATP-binding cassette domain-containing protein, partial [Butyrivibrio sp.]|nr:ABC-F family ATP-binding cassette domain-containing protein [Butyrivibrio sp.]